VSTFIGHRGAEAMFTAVGEIVTSIELMDEDIDIHTITLVLNGQHGEFDLVVEATDQDMEDRKWEAIAYRSGGVMGLNEVPA